MRQGPARPYASRLAVRFAIIIVIALLPAGIIAFVQTTALEREVQARSEAALMGATFRGASAETGVIRKVQGMAASLAISAPSVINDLDRCRSLMREVALQEPAVSLVAFVPTTGLMTCASVDREYDFSATPIFKSIVGADESRFFVNPHAQVSGTSVLGVTYPVVSATGASLGYISISLPHRALKELRISAVENTEPATVIGTEDVVFWTFDSGGTLLTSNVDLDVAAMQIPAAEPLTEYVGSESRVFQARSMQGNEMTYAVVPIVPNELYIMSAFAPEAANLKANLGLSVYLPTLLMWLAGLAASGFAAEVLVARHVRALNHAMVSFARGDRRLQMLDLKNPPAELEELGTAYVSMTDSIMRGEAELEDSVHQKEVLLREVHHRVKNNLQLISSIMNIQIRNAKGGEAKEIVKHLQERIMSLATVHRGLYQTSGLADVKARELIPDIVRQIMAISSNPDRPFDLTVDIDDLRLIPDQAVPMSLLLSEAMTNAIKHAGATRARPATLNVRLKRSGGRDAVLEVANSRNPQSQRPNWPNADTGLGTQLIVAFVQQLGGWQEAVVTEDSYTLKVTFRVAPLANAEERQVSHLDLSKAGHD